MAVQKMKRIAVCAGKRDRKKMLESLQRMGTVELCREEPGKGAVRKGERAVQPWEEKTRTEVREAISRMEKQAEQLERALQILRQMRPEKQSVFAALEGKPIRTEDLYQKGEKNRESVCQEAGNILKLARKTEALEAENEQIAKRIERLKPWKSLKIPLDFSESRRFAVIFGSLPGREAEKYMARMAKPTANAGAVTGNQEKDGMTAEEVAEMVAEIFCREGGRTYLGILCERRKEGMLRERLKLLGFLEAPSGDGNRAPAEEIRDLEASRRRNRDRLVACRQEMERMWEKKSQLELTEDYYRVRAQKYRVLEQLLQSKSAFFLEGYVPEKEAGKVKRRILEQFTAKVEVWDPDPGEPVPVLLKNGKITEAVQGVLEAFGLPQKGEKDPTAVMWIFYVFFFGMMLADAAYGFLTAVCCGILLLRFSEMSDVWRRSVKLFFWCGISTLIWGVLFGSYFGDAVDVAAGAFLGIVPPEGRSLLPAVWFAPIQDPMKMLLYAMLFGLIHLLTGLAIRGARCLREQRYGDFICQTVLWYLLLAGLLLLLIPGEIFRSVTGIHLELGPAADAAGKILAVTGAAGILFFAGRQAKNPFLRLALGAYELYNITGWLGDVLSYSRLLALGLATGVIASVINQMGVMLGPVGFVPVFLAGHLLNLAINLLGAYVHTCRLQYVEFFGKFYEGGGRPFRPFAQETKYVKIKEEL